MALACVLAGAAAGVALLAGSSATLDPVTRERAAALAARLGAELDRRAAELEARAAALAELPIVTRAVATDAATVQDLTQEELTLRPGPDEVVELGQIDTGGAAASLLRRPADSSVAPALDRPGLGIAITGHGSYLTVVRWLVPADTTRVAHGVVAVARPLALPEITALGVPARFEYDGHGLSAGTDALDDARPVERTAVPARVTGLALVLQPTSSSPVPGALALTLGLVLAAGVWWLGRRSAGQARPAAVTPAGLPSGQFGRYTLIRPLGSGGMAEVFLARATGEAGFAKQVALKIMHRALADNPVALDHFLDEARLMAQLDHPNLVQIADLGRAGDDYYIAMEYLDGSDLSALLASGRARGVRVPVPVALAILRKICDGLHAAHTALAADGRPLELVHRDVKAGNILVARTGAIKITDFGIAKASQRAVQTQLGMVKGTPSYMPPEQRVGQPVDRTADVYGVGAIAYELLTGVEINLDLEAIAHLGVTGWPHLAPPSQVRPELPPELDGVVFKALAYKPEDRHPTCAAFEEALETVAQAHGLVAGDNALARWIAEQLAILDTPSSRAS